MLGTIGLRTHIWNNALKSLALLAGFPVLLLLIVYAFALIGEALAGASIEEGLHNALLNTPSYLPIAIGGALLWFTIAFFINTRLVAAMTGAKPVTRQEQPRLYNLLENLCISRGLPMPRLCVIDSPALNAFASGVTQSQYTITVTTGLLDVLSDDEVEAVLAHELTHIRNSDVRLMIVAIVFAGIISLAADLFTRSWRIFHHAPGSGGWGGPSWGGKSSGDRRSGSGGGGGAIIVLILIAVAIIIIARLLAIVIRFAISRRREFMADGGAVELTKNPDAMISALRKIEGRSHLSDVPADVRPMFFDDHTKVGLIARLFATHPSIEDRVKALVTTAGGRDPGPYIPPAGPWGSIMTETADTH